ncbi:MAG: aspartate aminotransferase family protein, partial [Chloroflexi bacterium]|nr:aspartate aminotransferase family protein [Chloroflexota bacterium]
AVYAQMNDISYSPGGTVSPVTVRLAAKIASHAPDKESRVYFVSGGSEAVETALKMAKNYHKNNGEPTRWKVISRRGSYHGATVACMSLGGGGISAPVNFGPLMPGNIHVSQPAEYRCLHCRDKGGCNLECARDVERAIEHEGQSTVAAFIGEPISAAAGIHVPHPDYWPTIREICDRTGVIMICDEVITGFGRTGTMFATEHWDVTPDITTIAKALTSGYLPIGAAVATKKIADAFIGDEDSAFRHLITFGGNPASCAAGLANLEILEGEGMVENSAKMGDYLYEQLQTLYEHRIVGDVRGGMGLLAAVEIVKDRDTREKFPKEAELAKKINPLMDKHGLLGRAGDVIALSPPLCITKDEVDHLVQQLDQVIGEVESIL